MLKNHLNLYQFFHNKIILRLCKTFLSYPLILLENIWLIIRLPKLHINFQKLKDFPILILSTPFTYLDVL
jgi:hypothetical protein